MLVPLLLGVLGFGIYKAMSGGAKAVTAAGVPPYDVGLPAAFATQVTIAIGQGRGDDGSILPGETDPARVRKLAAGLAGYPIAQGVLNRYADGLAASPPTAAPAQAAPSSSASSGTSALGGLFSGGAFTAPATTPPATNVRDTRSAQAALVAWNRATGAGGDFGKQVATDVDGLAGPRTKAAVAAFVKWANANRGAGLAEGSALGPAVYAALEPWGAPSSSSSSAPTLSPALLASGLTGLTKSKAATGKILTGGTDILRRG